MVCNGAPISGSRRRLLLLAGALTAGACAPGAVLAAAARAAFRAVRLSEAMAALGAAGAQSSEALALRVNGNPGNAAQVAVVVSAEGLPGVDRLAVVVAENPRPVAADVSLGPGALPYLALRVKVAGSTEMIALARAGDRWFQTRRRVRVVEGACAG